MPEQAGFAARPLTKLLGHAALAICSALALLAALALFPAVVLRWETNVVVSGSMAPSVQVGDAVVAEPFHGQRLSPGAIAVFRDGEGHRISHRIVAVNGDGTYVTRGDANPQPDSTPLESRNIIGVGRAVIPRVGVPLVWAQTGQWLKLLLLFVVLGAIGAAVPFAFRGDGDGDGELPAPAPARPSVTTRRRNIIRGVAACAVVELMVGVALLVPGGARGAFASLTANPPSNFVAASAFGLGFDNASNAATTGPAHSLTWNHTVAAGTNRLLVVAVSLRKNDKGITAVTYGGVGGFVFAGRQIGGGADHAVEIWYKVAPPVGTAAVNVTLPGAGTVEMVAAAVSYTGIDQATPVGTFVGANATSKTPNVTVASATGEVVLGVLSNSGDTGTIAVGGGETLRWLDRTGTGDADDFGAGSSTTGAASVTLSWSMGKANKWVMGAIALKPA